MTALAPVIPEPSAAIPLALVERTSVSLIEWSAGAEMPEAREALERTLALEKYLAKRDMDGPMQTASRHLERRIGELLGPAEMGRPEVPISSHARELSKNDRVRFRLLAQHWVLIEPRLPCSRAVALRAVRVIEQSASPAHSNGTSLASGSFATLVADPPWQYDNVATRAAAANHYPTLSVEDLCALEVEGRKVSLLAANDSHLYLWTTNSFLPRAFEVMQAWGFVYKTCLTWVKPQLGIGNYFRSSTEHVLFGVRGDLRALNTNQRNWFEAKRGRHSRKPDSFYDLVEKVSPGPRLELFARSDMLGPREGWLGWGLEA